MKKVKGVWDEWSSGNPGSVLGHMGNPPSPTKQHLRLDLASCSRSMLFLHKWNETANHYPHIK